MQPQPQRPKIGIGVIVSKDGKILLGKRKGAHGAGQWSCPGGHLEFGETPHDCASRELAEETGLEALALSDGPWTNFIFDGTLHYVTLFVFVSDFTGKLQNLEPDKCEEWHWFSWNALPTPLFAPVQNLVEKTDGNIYPLASKS